MVTGTIPEHDREPIVDAGLTAAGVSASRAGFAALTDEIVTVESAWNAGATANAGRAVTQRGLAQLSPWAFEGYLPRELPADITDPVASIAAMWRFISAAFAVNLDTGDGLAEFNARWRERRRLWDLPEFTAALNGR